jgi:hypothetical protein
MVRSTGRKLTANASKNPVGRGTAAKASSSRRSAPKNLTTKITVWSKAHGAEKKMVAKPLSPSQSESELSSDDEQEAVNDDDASVHTESENDSSRKTEQIPPKNDSSCKTEQIPPKHQTVTVDETDDETDLELLSKPIQDVGNVVRSQPTTQNAAPLAPTESSKSQPTQSSRKRVSPETSQNTEATRKKVKKSVPLAGTSEREGQGIEKNVSRTQYPDGYDDDPIGDLLDCLDKYGDNDPEDQNEDENGEYEDEMQLLNAPISAGQIQKEKPEPIPSVPAVVVPSHRRVLSSMGMIRQSVAAFLSPKRVDPVPQRTIPLPHVQESVSDLGFRRAIRNFARNILNPNQTSQSTTEELLAKVCYF